MLLYTGVFILLLAVSSPIFIAFLSYNIQLKKIKFQVKHELIYNTPKSDLVAFTFKYDSEDFKNLDWKHKREFEYNGLMFDIVEADSMENEVYYLCFPDKQETALNHEFKDLLNQRYADDDSSNKNQRLISNFIRSLFVPEFTEENSFISTFYLKHNDYYSQILHQVYLERLSPPPQFV